MITGIFNYLGLYGFSINDLMFSIGVFFLIIALTKLYTKKNAKH